MQHRTEILIIGGGAAGLTCAMYLRRFHREAMVVDAGNTRLLGIPLSHNYPGFPRGLPGPTLLRRLRQQLEAYGGSVHEGTIVEVFKTDECFRAVGEDFSVDARYVVLATGVSDETLDMPEVDAAIARGYLRYCPICDGYEVTGKRVGVVVRDAGGLGEARYLRQFTERVTVIPLHGHVEFDEATRARMLDDGLGLADSPLSGLMLDRGGVQVEHADGRDDYDSLYCALGTRVHNHLAQQLGAAVDEAGYVVTDEHGQTNVDGLYAIGDLSVGINQIAVAVGKAAITASALQVRLGTHA
ncbi:NAD(P)/FAD-dependent oxidoreductase [Uliginosibacterium sp. sgz301328]|uniref:NAD(P)/FAD-dependent oxidoreductase n=1 Tax=Uliginosibacterium sp. sgz301328 TaxID=3243764 RepID=UPI00359CD134